MIDRLKPVTIEKGDLIIREGDDAGPLYILQKGRARAFAGVDGQTRNLAFYREGDFFGELSVLNGSPRAASVEAFTDCELLSLEPKSVQDLRRRFPEFDKLLSERLALYQAKTEARIPLDFTTELLPAETHVQNKVELDGQQPPADGEDKEEPFADERGLFRKRGKRIRKIDHVMQIDEMDCGAASLGMICRYFGRKVSLARIRQLCHTATDGTSLKALSRTATELGLAARALKISIRNLSLMPLPAIVHWEGNHWIVLYDVDEQFVRVADPAVGLRKLPRREFEAKWTGYAALFDYTPAFEQAPESKPTLAWLDRKSTRLNSSHSQISYAVFCLKKKKTITFSDQGRSFQAFYDFLLSPTSQHELTGLLERVQALAGIAESDARMRHIHYDRLDAA